MFRINKTIVLLLSNACFALACHAEIITTNIPPGGLLERRVDGVFIKGEFLDLGTNGTERLYIRYGPISDSGVLLLRTTNEVVLWRAFVEPLDIAHSKYCHVVSIHIEDDKIFVTSVGGIDVGIEDGWIYARGYPAKKIFEVRSLKTGALISRKVSDVPPQPSLIPTR